MKTLFVANLDKKDVDHFTSDLGLTLQLILKMERMLKTNNILIFPEFSIISVPTIW